MPKGSTRNYRQNSQHNTPRVGDAVYIDGKWVKDIHTEGGYKWVKANWSRVNGVVVFVDRDSQEATVKFTDHPYADKDEPKRVCIDFSTFYDRWDRKRELFVLTDDNIA